MSGLMYVFAALFLFVVVGVFIYIGRTLIAAKRGERDSGDVL